jgi:hypothetical protein
MASANSFDALRPLKKSRNSEDIQGEFKHNSTGLWNISNDNYFFASDHEILLLAMDMNQVRFADTLID